MSHCKTAYTFPGIPTKERSHFMITIKNDRLYSTICHIAILSLALCKKSYDCSNNQTNEGLTMAKVIRQAETLFGKFERSLELLAERIL